MIQMLESEKFLLFGSQTISLGRKKVQYHLINQNNISISIVDASGKPLITSIYQFQACTYHLLIDIYITVMEFRSLVNTHVIR